MTADQKICEAFQSDLYVRHMDVQAGVLWSMETIPVIIGEPIHFFSRPRFDPDLPGRSNMHCSARLPAPEAFSVKTISFRLLRCDPSDVLSVLDGLEFRFVMGTRSYASSPLCILRQVGDPWGPPFRICEYCTGVHVNDVCPGCGSREYGLLVESSSAVNNGCALVWEAEPRLMIENQITFYGEVMPRTGHDFRLLKPFDMVMSLEGLHARGIS